MDFYSAEAKIAVFHFIELLAIISILCVSFVIILLLYIKKNEKNRQLEKKNKEERQKAKAIIQVQEDERRRISRDLHDTVTQDIRTALLFWHRISSLPESANFSEQQKTLLNKIQSIEESNLKNIRTIIRNLTPPEIETSDFVRLISDFCASRSEYEKIPCKFHAEKNPLFDKLTAMQKLHIFRIIQESVNNSQKHSGAQEICVVMRAENDEKIERSAKNQKNGKKLVFLVSDDGHGFCPEKIENTENAGTHLGLSGIKSRAALLNAELKIKSNEETGTQIKLVVKI